MGTIDAYGNNHSAAGTSAGGQFASKTNTSPVSELSTSDTFPEEPAEKSPEQIASVAMDAFTFVSTGDEDDNDVEERDYYFIRDQIEAAIETDRAQRTSIKERDPHVASGSFKSTDEQLIQDTLKEFNRENNLLPAFTGEREVEVLAWNLGDGDMGYGSIETLMKRAVEADRAKRDEHKAYARASLEEYREKSERDSFEAVDGREWAEELAVILEGLVSEKE